MASKSSLCRQDCVGGVSSGMAGSAPATGAGGRRGTDTSRVSSVSSQFSDGPQHSPSSTHSSTPSWSEEPAQSNMDISTGHMILVRGGGELSAGAAVFIPSCANIYLVPCLLWHRLTWRTTCAIRTVCRRSGRRCAPTRLNPVPWRWLKSRPTWTKTDTLKHFPVSSSTCHTF